MTIQDTSILTYDRVGLREQLSDVIYNTDPDDTPLFAMMAKESVRGTMNEWQLDKLPSRNTANQQLEGEKYAAYPRPGATVRVGNYQNISHALFSVSGSAEAVEKAGRSSEVNYQTVLAGTGVKLDQEAIVWENIGGDAGSETTPRKTATLGAWLKTNVDKAANGANPVYTSGVPSAARTDGTQRALTETIFKNVMQLGWTNGAKFKYAFAGPVNKQKMSAFTGVVTQTFQVNGPKPVTVVAAADVYVSDFGTVTMLPNRLQRERDVYFIDPAYLQIDHLRPFKREEMAKQSDARDFVLRVEWGLRVKQEKTQGAAFDLTTT